MLTDIRDYRQIDERIGTSGLLTEAQIGEIARAGYDVVINLLPRDQHLPDEDVIVEEAGMEYVNIPVVWTSPRVVQADQFFEAMDARRDRKVWVHCAANMRVSVFVYLWRTLRMGEPASVAQADLDAIWQPNQIWRAFLHDVEATTGENGTVLPKTAVQ